MMTASTRPYRRFTDAPLETSKFVVPSFDRALSVYVNTVIGAGFELRGVEAPRPSEEHCEAHPSQRGWPGHAALFLHGRAGNRAG